MTAIALGRLLGAYGYGIYAYTMAWIAVLSVPATLGTQPLIARYLPAYVEKKQWGLARGLLKWALQSVVLASLFLAAVTAVTIYLFGDRIDPDKQSAFWIALISLPLLVVIRFNMAALRGLKEVVLGQIPEGIVRPFSFLALLGIAYLTHGNFKDPRIAMFSQVAACSVACLLSIILLRRHLPESVKYADNTHDIKKWIWSAFPLMSAAVIQIINNRVGILILGSIKGPEAAGIYQATSSLSELITFGLVAVNMALGPTIASFYVRGDLDELQRVATNSARFVLLFSVPSAVGIIIFGKWFLQLFGPAFSQGHVALSILCAGHILNASMGSVGLILNMTGHEQHTAKATLIAAIMNIGFNSLLVPIWGLEGAAISASSSLILWNLILVTCLYRELGINSTVLGRQGIKNRSIS